MRECLPMSVTMSILDSVCTMLYHIQLVFLIAATLLVLSIASLFVIEPGTASFVITVVNVATLLVVTMIFGGITWLCNNRQPSAR